MERKSLYDISWKISEEEYRADPALSYSTLAKYERTGFNQLEHLNDKISTSSLTFGSAVDSIITGGQEEFDSRFMVAEFPECPDSILKIVKSLFETYKDSAINLDCIGANLIVEETELQGYQKNWKPETRVKVIREKGAEYYNLLFLANNKTILSTKEYQEVVNAVNALRDKEPTDFYFAPNNPFENIERLYQLKFKATLEGIDYRCMADLLLIDYDKKIVYPKDLKTSSHTEWDFYKSFIDWDYQIQARLYWRIIRDNMNRDPYFKDFTLADYEFIVVNKKTLTPLIWRFDDTKIVGTLYYGERGQIKLRDPFEIGKELHYYLSSRPEVPIGIQIRGCNDLIQWLNKL